MGAGSKDADGMTNDREVGGAGAWRTVLMWLRLELGAYRRLRTELPTLQGEWEEVCPSKREDVCWAASVGLLIEAAWKYLDRDPEIAWRCYKAAARMMLHIFEDDTPVNRAEVSGRAAAVLEEANEKLEKKWRGVAIKKMLTGDGSKLDQRVELHRLLGSQRLLDEHHDNLYRKMTVLRKKLRVLQVAGAAAIGAWIWLWPNLRWVSDATSEMWQPWMASAVALMGATGAIISGFSSTKSIDDSRVPLQEAALAIAIARLVFGAMAALVVVSFMASGVVDLGKVTVLRALAVAVASGFSRGRTSPRRPSTRSEGTHLIASSNTREARPMETRPKWTQTPRVRDLRVSGEHPRNHPSSSGGHPAGLKVAG
jgi:hypothetical protein